MKKSLTPLYLIMAVLAIIVIFNFGKHVGYAKGRLKGCQEAIEYLQASTDSLNALYIEARDSYSHKLDSLIQEYDKK